MKEPEFEPCEMCGTPITYSFSLCDECDEKVKFWDEETGYYHMKDGEIVDTTKHQYTMEDLEIDN